MSLALLNRATGRFLLAMLGALLLVPTWSSADDKQPQSDAVKPVSRSEKGWLQRHIRFVVRAKQGNVDVLFLGDSITQGWETNGAKVWKNRYEPLHAANFGIGGDRTQHVLWRIKDGNELTGIQPKAVVLMIGTNNMGSNSAEQIADGISAIVQELRSQRPEAKLLLLGIFPRSAKPTDKLRDKIKDVNAIIAKLDDGKNVRYLDIGDKFLEKDGTLSKQIMPDYVHLTARGYEIWADAIQPSLDEMLKK
ncbi:MAG TPA: platelet-activating factor acetylhydrolase IB subunit [Gemmataceae bacterium]|nr:platelet-activating factor acetylhydrolase IB subunit [Gemmataceae bacterium]